MGLFLVNCFAKYFLKCALNLYKNDDARFYPKP